MLEGLLCTLRPSHCMHVSSEGPWFVQAGQCDVPSLTGRPAPVPALQAVVAEAVESIVGGSVGAGAPLMEAGIDSLGATELQQKLADTLGVELPSTLVFDYPTVAAMSEFIAGRVGGMARQAGDAVGYAGGRLAWDPSVAGAGAVGIVGAAGYGHSQLLQRHREGDASCRVPVGRWDVDSSLLWDEDGGAAPQVRACVCAVVVGVMACTCVCA